MKKLITFLFDHTIIGWIALVMACIIGGAFLLQPYATEIRDATIIYFPLLIPISIISYVGYMGYVYLKDEWINFNKTYNK